MLIAGLYFRILLLQGPAARLSGSHDQNLYLADCRAGLSGSESANIDSVYPFHDHPKAVGVLHRNTIC